MAEVILKRAYEPVLESDGQRILIDRVWPRGKSKSAMELTAWLKDIAPSSELRKWFGHKAERWEEFQQKYRQELDNNPQAISELRGYMKQGKVTLLYGAKDEHHNQAVVLRAYLKD